MRKMTLYIIIVGALLIFLFLAYQLCANRCKFYPAENFPGIISQITDAQDLKVWGKLKEERINRIHINLIGLDYSVYHFNTDNNSDEILSYFYEHDCSVMSETAHSELNATEIEMNCNNKGKHYLTIVFDPLTETNVVSYEKLSSKYTFSDLYKCCCNP
jgi:hypothetical protein